MSYGHTCVCVVTCVAFLCLVRRSEAQRLSWIPINANSVPKLKHSGRKIFCTTSTLDKFTPLQYIPGILYRKMHCMDRSLSILPSTRTAVCCIFLLEHLLVYCMSGLYFGTLFHRHKFECMESIASIQSKFLTKCIQLLVITWRQTVPLFYLAVSLTECIECPPTDRQAPGSISDRIKTKTVKLITVHPLNADLDN